MRLIKVFAILSTREGEITKKFLKMEGIAISVIVPIHNVSQYLESCLKSLQNQAFLYKYEVLLLLDLATEEDKKVVSSFSSVSNFVVYEVDFKDSGKVRNYGIEKSNGEYLAFVDGDDFVEANFLASLYNKAKESNSDIVISNYNFVKNGKKKKAFIKLKSKLKYSDSKKWAKKIYEDIKIRGYVWNKLYKRELIVKNRIKFPNTGEIIEDQSFNFLAFLNANKVSVQDKYLYNYVFRDNSVLHKDPMLFVNKYIRTLALLRYYSLKSDILKTTNVIFFFKKIMMLVYILQNKKYLNGSAFSYIKKIFKQISEIKKCSFSEFLSDEIFEKNYQILRGE